MNRRVSTCIASILFAVCFVGLASAKTSPEAEPVVRALEAHYRDIKTLKAVFIERYSDSRQGMEIQSGTVYFERPGRMRWEYESPERKLFVTDGKTVWFFVPADRTVTRSPIKKSADWRTPLALLTGNTKLSRLCDRVDLVGNAPGAPGHAVLSCIPRGQGKSARAAQQPETDGGGDIAGLAQRFDRVLLEVDRATGSLADVRILQPGDIELEFRFGNWQENLPLESSLFRFHVPIGVAVVNGATSGAEP
jgi:outer membrane lipoprotein-sorting protein